MKVNGELFMLTYVIKITGTCLRDYPIIDDLNYLDFYKHIKFSFVYNGK